MVSIPNIQGARCSSRRFRKLAHTFKLRDDREKVHPPMVILTHVKILPVKWTDEDSKAASKLAGDFKGCVVMNKAALTSFDKKESFWNNKTLKIAHIWSHSRVEMSINVQRKAQKGISWLTLYKWCRDFFPDWPWPLNGTWKFSINRLGLSDVTCVV